jgi:hypothetical protein
MKKVYIAGPYRSDTVSGIWQNINKAWGVARKYNTEGYAVFCPHLNTMLMDGINTDEHFLESGLIWLEVCDIVVMIPGWSMSKGAVAEEVLAKKLGKQIIYEEDENGYDGRSLSKKG